MIKLGCGVRAVHMRAMQKHVCAVQHTNCAQSSGTGPPIICFSDTICHQTHQTTQGGHSDPACNTKLRSGQVKRCSCDICFMCVDTSVCACNRSAFRLLGLGMGVWTLAAAGCGASWNFGSLMFFRAFVGVGEASFVALAAPFIGGSCKILCGSERCDVARMCGLLHVAFATFRLKHAFPTATSR